MKDHESFFQGFSYLLLSTYGGWKYKEDGPDFFRYSCLELLKTFQTVGLIKTYAYQGVVKGNPYWFLIELYFAKDPAPYYLVYYKDNRVEIEKSLSNHMGLEVLYKYNIDKVDKKIKNKNKVRSIKVMCK